MLCRARLPLSRARSVPRHHHKVVSAEMRGALAPGAVHRTVLRGSGGHVHAPEVGTRETRPLQQAAASCRTYEWHVRATAHGARGAGGMWRVEGLTLRVDARELLAQRAHSQCHPFSVGFSPRGAAAGAGGFGGGGGGGGGGASLVRSAAESVRCAMIFRLAPAGRDDGDSLAIRSPYAAFDGWNVCDAERTAIYRARVPLHELTDPPHRLSDRRRGGWCGGSAACGAARRWVRGGSG